MIVISNPEKYHAGLYERLSNENIEENGKVINDSESGSISTQKLVNESFCKQYNITKYKHYADDGYTGATFDRPAFKRLIEDIEKGIINLVIVKDLSRFGRRTSKILYYLQEYFIDKGVRFIAITESFDTGDLSGNSEFMMILKSAFNEMFLSDTSSKIRKGKETRARAGKVMAVYPTYGYKKDPADKNHYIVDEEVAPIVKEIFALAKTGKNPTDIGKILTDRKIPVPSEVVGNNHTRKGAIKRGWNRNTVVKILQNVTYLGWVSNGNTKKESYRSKKIKIVPKNERIVIPNKHTPLVDKETFDIVQDMIKSRTATRVKSHDWLLKGLVCCKECGKKLSVVEQKHPHKTTLYLRCNTYATNTHLGLCTPHSNNLEKVTDIVISQIKKRCMEFLEEERYQRIAQKSMNNLNSKFSIPKQIELLEKQVKQVNIKIDDLYDRKFTKEMEEEDYTRMYEKYTLERAELKQKIQELKEEELKPQKIVDVKKIVKEFVSFKEVTREMLVSLVDRIEISQDKEITIYYKFNILNVAELQDQEQEEETISSVG